MDYMDPHSQLMLNWDHFIEIPMHILNDLAKSNYLLSSIRTFHKSEEGLYACVYLCFSYASQVETQIQNSNSS